MGISQMRNTTEECSQLLNCFDRFNNLKDKSASKFTIDN
jgi:hypothetical protein